MTNKITILKYPQKGDPPYGHLQPIVDFLLQGGNVSANSFLWGNNRTGYFCHLKNNIDFEGVKEIFNIPDSIKIDEDAQTIDCLNTYSLIKKI